MSSSMNHRSPPILARSERLLLISDCDGDSEPERVLGDISGLVTERWTWEDVGNPNLSLSPMKTNSMICFLQAQEPRTPETISKCIRNLDPSGRASIILAGGTEDYEVGYLKAGIHHFCSLKGTALHALVIGLLKLAARRRALERYSRHLSREYLSFMVAHEINNSLAICDPSMFYFQELLRDGLKNSCGENVGGDFGETISELNDGFCRLREVSSALCGEKKNMPVESKLLTARDVIASLSAELEPRDHTFSFQKDPSVEHLSYSTNRELLMTAVGLIAKECTAVTDEPIHADLRFGDGRLSVRIAFKSNSTCDPDTIIEPNYAVENGIVRYSPRLSAIDALVTEHNGFLFSYGNGHDWQFTIQMDAVAIEQNTVVDG